MAPKLFIIGTGLYGMGWKSLCKTPLQAPLGGAKKAEKVSDLWKMWSIVRKRFSKTSPKVRKSSPRVNLQTSMEAWWG